MDRILVLNMWAMLCTTLPVVQREAFNVKVFLLLLNLLSGLQVERMERSFASTVS